jgi:hypothetical protein
LTSEDAGDEADDDDPSAGDDTQGDDSSDDDVSGGDDPVEPEPAGTVDGGPADDDPADAGDEAVDGDDDTSAAGSGGLGPAPVSTADPDSPYHPPCGVTPALSGEEIKKGTFCTPEDPQLCYRECGPFQVGWKTETCLAGVYAEGDCSFPEDGDYSCFAIPDEIDTSVCPTDSPPRSTEECDVPACTLCNINGQYRDTSNNAKDGYCVCRPPDEEGVRTWTCASTTAWPCPFSRGC